MIERRMILWHRHSCLRNTGVLFFVDPDTEKTFLVYEKNMEFCWGKNNGWFVLAVCSDRDDSNDYEAKSLEVACEVIGDSPQADGIIVLREG